MKHVSMLSYTCHDVTFYKVITTLLIISYLKAYILMIATKIILFYLRVLRDLCFASLPVRNKSEFYFSHLISYRLWENIGRIRGFRTFSRLIQLRSIDAILNKKSNNTFINILRKNNYLSIFINYITNY